MKIPSKKGREGRDGKSRGRGREGWENGYKEGWKEKLEGRRGVGRLRAGRGKRLK